MCGALPPDLHHITPDTVMREITLLMEIIWDNSSLGVFAILQSHDFILFLGE